MPNTAWTTSFFYFPNLKPLICPCGIQNVEVVLCLHINIPAKHEASQDKYALSCSSLLTFYTV